MKKHFGNLSIGINKYNQERIYIDGFEPTLYISRLISDSYDLDRGKVSVAANIHNAKLIDMVMSKFPMDIKEPKRWEELLNEVEHFDSISDKILKLDQVEPDESKFIGKLRPFQKEGLDFFNKTDGNCLLADEMGLGKTVQTLAFLSTREDAFPVLIISPLVTLRNWDREIKKFIQLKQKDGLFQDQFGEPRNVVIRSGKSGFFGTADFYIINYDLIAKRKDDLLRLNPRTIVCDEIQNLRSMKTGKFTAVKEIAEAPFVKYRIGLSGTPIYNRGSEIWGMVDMIRKGMLGSYKDFLNIYCYGWGDRYVVTEDKQKTLSKVLRDHVMLRRKKIDVLTDLPDKVRYQQTISIDSDYYQEEIRKIFKRVQDARAAINNTDFANEKEKKTKIFELNAESRKSLAEERQIAGISKAPYIVEYVKELLENTEDEKIVIFLHHKKVHQIVMEGLWEHHPVRIVGGQTDKDKDHSINEFQTNPDRRLIVCGIRAGNVGINLTAGTYVIFGELDYSPPVHKQAEDRLHRIGQKKTVIAHYLIGEETMDEKIAEILTDKALEIDAVMGDKKEELDNKRAIDVLESLYSKMDNRKSIITKLTSPERNEQEIQSV